ARSHDRYVVVEVDASPDDGVLLETAVFEARLRNAPLRALMCWNAHHDHDQQTALRDGHQRALADLDRRLARWRRRYPDLRAESVAVHGTILDYLGKNARSVQLMVAGANGGRHVHELTGPSGNAVLHHAACSVLIFDHRHL